MKQARRDALLRLAAAAAVMAAASCACPARAGGTTTLVVTYPPGGASDHLARRLAPGLAEALGLPVEVRNEPGGGANLALALVAKAPADGRTIALVTTQHAINATYCRSPGYDLRRDLAPVAGISAMPLVLAVNPKLAAGSVDELLALAEAVPGRLHYASSGVGGTPHLAMVELNALAGTSMTHLPRDGSGPAGGAVIGGEADLLLDTTVAALPAVRDGRLRGLAVTSAARSPAAPDLPTLAEAGLPGLEVASWNGLVAPAGTPAALVERLHAATAGALADPEVRAELSSLGAAVKVTTPAEFGAALAAEIAAWARLVRESGLAGSA